ncbi:hypothetical protein PAPYR_2563 [Paratrimastix pyriformis]|uniref:Uncharacterized protein n=1 Tax=Paratrimastix pyriformis TaxID=342808 RepID=A0ABQ8UPK9_9EUKA|nr:hypothetical protein PAPYR_2563 [Paratrimastix pyriformis]
MCLAPACAGICEILPSTPLSLTHPGSPLGSLGSPQLNEIVKLLRQAPRAPECTRPLLDALLTRTLAGQLWGMATAERPAVFARMLWDRPDPAAAAAAAPSPQPPPAPATAVPAPTDGSGAPPPPPPPPSPRGREPPPLSARQQATLRLLRHRAHQQYALPEIYLRAQCCDILRGALKTQAFVEADPPALETPALCALSPALQWLSRCMSASQAADSQPPASPSASPPPPPAPRPSGAPVPLARFQSASSSVATSSSTGLSSLGPGALFATPPRPTAAPAASPAPPTAGFRVPLAHVGAYGQPPTTPLAIRRSSSAYPSVTAAIASPSTPSGAGPQPSATTSAGLCHVRHHRRRHRGRSSQPGQYRPTHFERHYQVQAAAHLLGQHCPLLTREGQVFFLPESSPAAAAGGLLCSEAASEETQEEAADPGAPNAALLELMLLFGGPAALPPSGLGPPALPQGPPPGATGATGSLLAQFDHHLKRFHIGHIYRASGPHPQHHPQHPLPSLGIPWGGSTSGTSTGHPVRTSLASPSMKWFATSAGASGIGPAPTERHPSCNSTRHPCEGPPPGTEERPIGTPTHSRHPPQVFPRCRHPPRAARACFPTGPTCAPSAGPCPPRPTWRPAGLPHPQRRGLFEAAEALAGQPGQGPEGVAGLGPGRDGAPVPLLVCSADIMYRANGAIPEVPVAEVAMAPICPRALPVPVPVPVPLCLCLCLCLCPTGSVPWSARCTVAWAWAPPLRGAAEPPRPLHGLWWSPSPRSPTPPGPTSSGRLTSITPITQHPSHAHY